MKRLHFLWLPLALCLTGCGEKSDASKSDSSDVTTAPADYLKSAADAHHSAVKTVDTSAIQKAIDLFQVEKGRFPKDLNELVTEKFLPKLPDVPTGMKLDYDAGAGTVKVVPQ